MAVQLDVPDRSSDQSLPIDPLTSGTNIKQFTVGAVRTIRVLNYTGNTVFLSFKNVSQLSASWDSVVPAWTERSTSYVGGGQLSVVQVASGYTPGPYDQVLVQASPIPEAPYMAQLPQAVTISGNVGISGTVPITGNVGVSGSVPITSVASYALAVKADAPAIWYRMGEASGTLMGDNSGNGRTGAYTLNVTLGQPGAVHDADTAVRTAGMLGSYTAGTGLPVGNAPRSTELWIKCGPGQIPSGAASPCPLYYGDTLGTAGHRWELYFPTNTQISVFTALSGPVWNVPALDDNAWHHIVITWDGASFICYLDGTSYGAQAAAALVTTLDAAGLTIGTDGVLNTRPYTGLMDEVAVYNKALGPDQVAHHFQAGLGLGVLQQQPITLRSAPASVLYSSAQGGAGAGYTALSTVIFASISRPSKLYGAWAQFYYGGAPPPSTYGFGYFELRGIQTNTVLFLAATMAAVVNGPVYGQEFYGAPLDLTALFPNDTTLRGTAFWQGLSPPANYNQAGGIYYGS